MDARQTQAEKADLKATQDTEHRTAAQQSAMRQSAAIHERDARTGAATPADVRFEQPEKDDQVVTTFRGQKVVTREEAEEIVLQEKLEAAESEVSDDGLWYILTRVFKPDSLLRLLANRRAAVAKAEAVVPETAAEKKAREDREAAETPAEAKARKDREAAAKKAPEFDFVPEPVPTHETDAERKTRLERDRVRKASPAKTPGADTSHYIHDQIILATESDNRP